MKRIEYKINTSDFTLEEVKSLNDLERYITNMFESINNTQKQFLNSSHYIENFNFYCNERK